MILELEALMTEVDNAQRALDAKKRSNGLNQTNEADMTVSNSRLFRKKSLTVSLSFTDPCVLSV